MRAGSRAGIGGGIRPRLRPLSGRARPLRRAFEPRDCVSALAGVFRGAHPPGRRAPPSPLSPSCPPSLASLAAETVQVGGLDARALALGGGSRVVERRGARGSRLAAVGKRRAAIPPRAFSAAHGPLPPPLHPPQALPSPLPPPAAAPPSRCPGAAPPCSSRRGRRPTPPACAGAFASRARPRSSSARWRFKTRTPLWPLPGATPCTGGRGRGAASRPA